MNDVPQFAVFDIEATDWIKFEALGFYDGQSYAQFKKPFHKAIGRFLDHLNQPKYNGFWIYAHNGGGYDFKFLLEELLDRGWIKPDGITDRNGRLIRIGVETPKFAGHKHIQFQFVDSYAALPSSLRKLGIAFKTPHQKQEIDYSKISSRSAATLEYLENDCLCLYEVLQSYQSMEHIYSRKMTIASQAMNTFTKGFCPGTIERMTLADDSYVRENFYAGGRVEVFKGFGTDLNYYDVNSLYPFAMLQKMPIGNAERVGTYRKGETGFYQIEVKNTPDWYVSPLIVKGKKNCFMKGPGQYFVSSNTLEQLREEGVRWKVLSGMRFSGAEFLFNSYVEFFYHMKQFAKTDAEKLLAKLMLNTLYGKFGQGQWRDAVSFVWGVENFDYMIAPEYGLCYVTQENRNRFIMPYLAAWVTDYARLYHYRLMAQHPGNMFYCDTDSLITTAKYPVGDKIGQLKLEGYYKEGVFISPKTYALRNSNKDQKVAFKGFDADNFTFATLKKALFQKLSLTEKRTRILGWKEAIKRKKDYISKTGKFLVLVETKKTTKGGPENRLHFESKKHIFDTTPLQRNAPSVPASSLRE